MTNPQLSAPGPEISAFESIKQRDDQGREFWHARDLMTLLGYKLWQNFERVITEAIAICQQEGDNAVALNFIAITKNSPGASSRGRKGGDYILTRHACYLVAESADGRKYSAPTLIQLKGASNPTWLPCV